MSDKNTKSEQSKRVSSSEKEVPTKKKLCTDEDAYNRFKSELLEQDDSLLANWCLHDAYAVSNTSADSLFKNLSYQEHAVRRSLFTNDSNLEDLPSSPVLSTGKARKYKRSHLSQIQKCEGGGEWELSQFCETSQFVREIDKVLTCELEKENDHTYTVSETPPLFKTQYRQGIEVLFDTVETSLCLPNGSDSIDSINESMRSVDQSFGTVIKRALIENVEKPLVFDTVVEEPKPKEVNFVELGPFYGLPVKVKELITQYKGIETLYDWQDECLRLDPVKNRKNLVYALPTSGGKTLVAEILMLREVLCRKHNVLFVLPYVSIVQEKVWALSSFAVSLEFLVEEYAAGKGQYPPRKRRHKHSIFVATIEKALGLVNSLIETNRIEEIGLVVVDELHLLGDSERGSRLEVLLTKLMYAGSDIHIVGMSATIGNLPEVCTFLNAEAYTRDFRPVELKEYVKFGNIIAEIDCKAAGNADEMVTAARQTDFRYSEMLSKMDPDCIGGLVMEVVPKGSCLVFCPSKKNCENVAILLSRILTNDILETKRDEKKQLLEDLQLEGALCPILKKTIPYGIAYHHSGLTWDERKYVEEAFRIGTLCVICCTSTLAAGVNLPAQRVIVRSPYIGRDFINLSRYKQMVGRAGRAGFGEVGESILLCEQKDLQKVKDLLCSPMDQAISALHQNNGSGLRNLLLSCIGLGLATTRTTLRAVTNCTLLAVQAQRLNVNLKQLIDSILTTLFKDGALQLNAAPRKEPNTDVSLVMEKSQLHEISASLLSPSLMPTPSGRSSVKKRIILNNDSRLYVSKLGRAAIKGGLELDKAHILYEDLRFAQSNLVLLDCLHLLYLVTPYELAEQVKPVMSTYHRVYMELGANELKTACAIGITEYCAMQMISGKQIKNVPERVLNRFYLTLILHELWNEASVFEVAEKYQVNRGIVQQLMTSSATFASCVVHFCEELEEFWTFCDLLKGMSQKISHCCSRELLPLMELPAVKQSRARQLYDAGYKTLQNVAKAKPNDLVNAVNHMSRKVALQLISAAKLLLLEKVENLREEAEDLLV